ncbi:RND transporter [Tenacibaculum litopenaei]|uniref:efflux RND transporter periplasmic adaptor subunit n=1 Tax=Tenacibaculum litopenaei TaxID=396016 RepID=UPI0038944F13
MKKYGIYIALLVVGISVGYLLKPSTNERSEKQTVAAHSQHKNQKWTCSMHPQIMKNEPGDCPICGMDLIPAAAGHEGLAAGEFKLSKNAMALANIAVSKVQANANGGFAMALNGMLVENDKTNKTIASYFKGRIERLLINTEGEQVKKGQLLAYIYAPELVKAQQELLTAYELRATQPQLLKAVKNKLKYWKISEATIQRVLNSKKIIENFPIHAPVSGTVVEKKVLQGDYVNQGQLLFTIADLRSVWGVFDLYERQLASVKLGQQVAIKTEAYPAKVLKGTVSFIDPLVDQKTRTAKIRVEIPNPTGQLKPGMFLRGQMDGQQKVEDSLLSIPASAVLWTGKRSVVYVKTNPSEPIFELREVLLGQQQGAFYQVLSGVKEGEVLVTNGVFTVDAAAQLKGKKSMMNKKVMQAMTFEVSKEFKGELQRVFSAYSAIKDALVNTNLKAATQNAGKFQVSLEEVDAALLFDKMAKKHWKNASVALNAAIAEVQQAKAIDQQRVAFESLSLQMISLVKSFGILTTVYKQYCPMAARDKGAYWLSDQKEIRNPYFGDQMLKCGEVKEIISNH